MKLFSVSLLAVLFSASSAQATFQPVPPKTVCGKVSFNKKTVKKDMAPKVRCFAPPCPQPKPDIREVVEYTLSVMENGKPLPFVASSIEDLGTIEALHGKTACIKLQYSLGKHRFESVEKEKNKEAEEESDPEIDAESAI